METLTAIKLPISHENIEIWQLWLLQNSPYLTKISRYGEFGGNLWGLVHYHFIDEEPGWVTYAVVP